MQHKRTLRTISLFFTLNLLLVGLTFYNSFYRITTSPEHYPAWVIIHAFSLALWVVILFIQPLFIYSNNQKWHKQLGLFSIAVVALIIITTVASAFETFKKLPDSFSSGKKQSILLSQFYGMFLFALLYTKSLLNAKVFSAHVQYITASLIVILGPVIFRATNTFHLALFGTVELTCNVLTYGILNLLLMLLCVIQTRQKESFGPYLFTMAALLPIEISQVWFCLA